MFRYGQKVVIRDGSLLDGASGVVYRAKDGPILVLIDREVLWPVSEEQLEALAPGSDEARSELNY